MTVTWSWNVEMYLSGAWTSVSADVRSFDHDIVATHGIDGNDVESRVAAPGTITFYMDNSEANSAGLLGYYSPDHANCRTDFARGTLARISLTSAGSTRYLMRGKIDEIEPIPGQFGKRETMVQCVDFMQELVDHKLAGIPVQTGKRPDQLVSTILANMANSATNTSIATDTVTLSYALHSERDEKSTAMSAMQKVCMTALGYFFVSGDATAGETATYQMRHTRSSAALAATFSDTMSELRVVRSGKKMSNKVVAATHPAQIDSGANTLLATLVNEFQLDGGAIETITLRLRDPSGASARVSGFNFVTPLVADTHFKMSSASGDSGNDLNSNLALTLSAGGNTVEIELENTGVTRGYINKLDILGDGIYLYDPLEIVIESGSADKSLNYDFYYQDDYYVGKDFATAVHGRVSFEVSEVSGFAYFADADSTLMSYALTIDIGSRIMLSETATGISDEYFVNQVTWRILKDGRLKVEYLLEPASVVSFFVLDTDQLDDTGVKLAF